MKKSHWQCQDPQCASTAVFTLEFTTTSDSLDLAVSCPLCHGEMVWLDDPDRKRKIRPAREVFRVVYPPKVEEIMLRIRTLPATELAALRAALANEWGGLGGAAGADDPGGASGVREPRTPRPRGPRGTSAAVEPDMRD